MQRRRAAGHKTARDGLALGENACDKCRQMLQDFLQTAFLPDLLALLAAYALALPIGIDRERGTRSAGLRTFPLVAVASCGFIQASESVVAGNAEATARIVEGLITGMGFIGGGAILRRGSSVKGTATAASLWATGAIGVSVGLESYDVAIALSIITFLTLRALKPLKRHSEDDYDDPDPAPRRSPRAPVPGRRYRRI